MVDPLLSVPVSLVDGVHTQVARSPLRVGLPPLTDVDRRGLGLVDGHAPLAVDEPLPQPVQMRHRDRAQARELAPAEHGVLPAEDGLGGRSGETVVGVVHLRQQCLIFTGVLGGEPVPSVLRKPHPACAPVLGDEAADLGRGVARHLPHVPS